MYQENEEYLTKTEKLCFENLLKNIDIKTDITIQKIADETSVSTTTIFRMIKNLGYESFRDFRYDLLYLKREKFPNRYDDKKDALSTISESLAETEKLLRESNIDPIVDKIINAKRVMVCGSGMNNYIGGILEVKLNLCNIDTKYREDSWLMYLESSNLTKDDRYDDKKDALSTISESLAETEKLLRESNIDPIVDKIINAKRVMVCGSGMNNYIGGILEVKLNLCNIDTKYREDSWLMYLESSNLTKDDVVIILSKSGETKSLIDIVKNIKLNGVSVIYIGEVGYSTIGDLADYKLSVAKVEEEGIDMDSRLQEHFAVNLLTKKITDKIQAGKQESV